MTRNTLRTTLMLSREKNEKKITRPLTNYHGICVGNYMLLSV